MVPLLSHMVGWLLKNEVAKKVGSLELSCLGCARGTHQTVGSDVSLDRGVSEDKEKKCDGEA